MKSCRVKAKHSRTLRENMWGYGFIAPSLILLAIFVLVPIIMSIYYSFTKYNVINQEQWVGLKNYVRVFEDSNVIAALKNTLLYTAVTVPVQTVLSLAIAAMLAAKFKNRMGEVVRSSMFIPVLCSAVLAGTVFYYIFSSNNDGIVNQIVMALGGDKTNWLGSDKTALLVICFVNIWKGVGYYLVIFYAAIMDIPKSYYEASSIDGATSIQQFFYITLPSVRPVLYLVVTLCTIWSFQVFDITYVMTQGGPGISTTTLVLEIYENGFGSFRMGYASAIAIVLFVIVLLISYIQRRLFKEKV